MTTRWLLNENFPQPSVLRLRTEGWDIASVSEEDAGAEDYRVMERACNERRWLATFDRDYGELIFQRRLPAPLGVVLLRVPSYLPHEPAEWLIQLQRESQLKDGCFHVFDGDALRRRPFLSNISGGIG